MLTHQSALPVEGFVLDAPINQLEVAAGVLNEVDQQQLFAQGKTQQLVAMLLLALVQLYAVASDLHTRQDYRVS